jgi:hypothetical protein
MKWYMLLLIPWLMYPLIFLWLYRLFRLWTYPNKCMMGVLSSPFTLPFSYAGSNILLCEFLSWSSLSIFLATTVQSHHQYSTWCWYNTGAIVASILLKTRSRTGVTSWTDLLWLTQKVTWILEMRISTCSHMRVYGFIPRRFLWFWKKGYY